MKREDEALCDDVEFSIVAQEQHGAVDEPSVLNQSAMSICIWILSSRDSCSAAKNSFLRGSIHAEFEALGIGELDPGNIEMCGVQQGIAGRSFGSIPAAAYSPNAR